MRTPSGVPAGTLGVVASARRWVVRAEAAQAAAGVAVAAELEDG